MYNAVDSTLPNRLPQSERRQARERAEIGPSLIMLSHFDSPILQIRFFFEQKAFTDGKLNRPKELAINKVSSVCREVGEQVRPN